MPADERSHDVTDETEQADAGAEQAQDGFELQGRFYRWHLTDRGKDLLLIDRIAQMPVDEFFELVEDEFDRTRTPVLLAMIATSIRAEHPQWSHQRIERIVLNLSLSEDITFIEGEVDASSELEDALRPPDEPDGQAPEVEPSPSPADESSSSSTPRDRSESETLYATPA